MTLSDSRDLEKENLRLQDELFATARERDSLFAEVEAARERIHEASREADLFKSRLDEALAKLRDNENKLRTQSGELQKHDSGVNENIAELQKRIDSLSQQLKNERESFLRQEQELMRISEQNRQRAEQDRRECQRLEEELLGLRHDAIDSKQKIEEADKEINDKSENISELQRQIAVLEKKLQAGGEQREQLQGEIESLKSERAESETDLRDEIARKLLTLEQVQQKLGQESKERAALESRLEAEKQKTESVLKEYNEKEQSVLARENQARESSRRYQTLLLSARHELSELQVRYDRLEREKLNAKSENRHDRVELLNEIRRMEKKLVGASDKLRETEKQMVIEKRVAMNQVDQLRAQIRNAVSLAEREKNSMKQELEQLRSKAQDVLKRESGFDSEVTKIRAEYTRQELSIQAELEKKVEALRKTAAAFEDESRRNQALEDQVISLRGLLEEMEKKLRLAQAQMQKEQKIYQRKMSGSDEQQAQLSGNLAKLTAECANLNTSLLKSKEREMSLRGTVKTLRAQIEQMQEQISAAVASKAYVKEKLEAVESARSELSQKYEQENNTRVKIDATLKGTVKTYEEREQKFKEERENELKKIEHEHSRETAAYREEIETLTVERDNAMHELSDEKGRNEQMLQNLLSMRDELEMAQDASNASKTFLKDKVKQLEAKLENYQTELVQEEKKRNELEQQLRELRRKMEFA